MSIQFIGSYLATAARAGMAAAPFPRACICFSPGSSPGLSFTRTTPLHTQTAGFAKPRLGVFRNSMPFSGPANSSFYGPDCRTFTSLHNLFIIHKMSESSLLPQLSLGLPFSL